MIKLYREFADDECGATAIEYALIMIIVAVGIVASLQNLRTALNDQFTLVVAGFSN